MATDQDIVKSLNDHLRANGYTCGRNYANVGGVVKSITAGLPNETEQTLGPKVRRLIKAAGYGFKTRNADSEVSAADSSDPKCGS